MDSETAHLFQQLFVQTEAIRDGHYEFTPTYHSRFLIDFARVTQTPELVSRIAKRLYAAFAGERPSFVLTPNPTEGLVLAHSVADRYGAHFFPAVRRGGIVSLPEHTRLQRQDTVLLVDDGLNTGNSMRQLVDLVRRAGARCCGVSVCVTRFPGDLDDFSVPVASVFDLSTIYPLQRVEGGACDQCRAAADAERRLAYETLPPLRQELTRQKMTLELRSAYGSYHREF